MKEEEKIKKDYIEVKVVGKSSANWDTLRDKLIQAINSFLDSTIDYENNTSIRDEAKKFTSALIDHAKAKLQKEGIENDKMLAEIDLMYARKSKEIAEARKINAEASELEFNLSMRKLKAALGMAKILCIGDDSEQNMFFVKEINGFLEVIEDYSNGSKLIG